MSTTGSSMRSGRKKPKSVKTVGKRRKKCVVDPFEGLVDPWSSLESPYGGKLGANDELAILTGDPAAVTPFPPFVSFEVSLKDGGLSADDIKRLETATSGAVSLTNQNLTRLAKCPQVAALISLNLTGNALEQTSLSSCRFDCLRSLTLCRNKLKRVPSLLSCPKLLSLDLSFNPIGETFVCVESGDAFGRLSTLRHLSLDGCSITSLGAADCPFKTLTALERLSLALNPELTDASDIHGAISLLKRIRVLVLPVDGGEEWTVKLRRSLPCLTSFNESAHVATIHDTSATLGDGVAVEESFEDSATCSCIEGNACVSPYHCKDWEHRLEVARRAREQRYFAPPT